MRHTELQNCDQIVRLLFLVHFHDVSQTSDWCKFELRAQNNSKLGGCDHLQRAGICFETQLCDSLRNASQAAISKVPLHFPNFCRHIAKSRSTFADTAPSWNPLPRLRLTVITPHSNICSRAKLIFAAASPVQRKRTCVNSDLLQNLIPIFPLRAFTRCTLPTHANI